jgi:2-polyprenyl-3-methyl-5-hydroxy-6-metoxy-1,4-benzoquinol methylase
MSTTGSLSTPDTPSAGRPATGTSSGEGQLTDRRYWERNWQQSDQPGYRIDGARRYSEAVMERVLRRRLVPDPSRRFLEVGCGSGRWLVYFHRTFGYQVTGCDYSEASCRLARRQLEAAGVPGTVLQGDLFALTGGYDVVRSGGLVEHFTDPKSVLEKFVTLLAPGGTLITTVPNLAGLSGLYQRWWKPETFTTHRVVTLGELTRWYDELGLKKIEARAYGSIVPERFPHKAFQSAHPQLPRVLSDLVYRLVLGGTNRACLLTYRRLGWQVEAPSFSPYLYAVGDKL